MQRFPQEPNFQLCFVLRMLYRTKRTTTGLLNRFPVRISRDICNRIACCSNEWSCIMISPCTVVHVMWMDDNLSNG